MKILHTADWHLGNNFHGYDRTDEHRHFLRWLLEVMEEKQPDVLIVAGDVFDTANPSARAEELLYDFLLRATQTVRGLQIVLIAGNHDSAGRLEAPASLLKTLNIYVRGTVHFTAKGTPDFDYYGKDNFMDLQKICVKMILNDGDTLPHWGFRKLRNGKVVPFVQLISAKAVKSPDGIDNKKITGGVELDEATGKEVAYYLTVIDFNRNETNCRKR